nr:MFS transporter [Amycolatopsis vastitatis]
MRPLGGLVLGAYADRHGRKKALVWTIRLMVLGTLLLVLLPGYARIGILAPLGVIVARLVQGFAAGGEFSAATSFLIEQDNRRKGFLGSFQFASQGLSTLLSAGFAAGLTAVLSDDAMTSWGWRVPFAFGLLIGPIGWYIRRHVDESPVTPAKKAPIRELFRNHWGDLTIAMTIPGLLKAAYFGALPSVMADAFPAHTRATGLSFGYNATVGIFGGFTPTIAATLIATTGSPVSPGYYLVLTACLSVAALVVAHRRRGIN